MQWGSVGFQFSDRGQSRVLYGEAVGGEYVLAGWGCVQRRYFALEYRSGVLWHSSEIWQVYVLGPSEVWNRF